MMMIEPFAMAPEWLQKTVKALIAQASDGPGPRVLEPVAVAFFRIYDEGSAARYPSLRDRSDEVRLMLMGLANDPKRRTCTSAFTNTGAEFYRLNTGFDPVGAQFAQTFRLMVI